MTLNKYSNLFKVFTTKRVGGGRSLRGGKNRRNAARYLDMPHAC